ncbi:MAG: hypothetical protein IJO11_07445 [Alphaproteobacteria bacterium]|nr:hypothetical protein [Alphaproteobacteria bacterium]
MQIKVNEIGRSMVEMLGVLAIIGILSITGVGTYQYALTAHQAGKVQDVLGKAKILAQTDSRTSHALEVNRFIKSALPEYSSDDKKSMVKLVNGKYQVTTFKVVHKVCEKLLQKESIFNEMGISVLTKICGNQNSKVNMVFEFNATQTVETGTHFDGNNSSTVEPQSCPDKMVYRQKNDGTYGCICRHEYEFGDNCERCYPPKEWFDTENICRCPDYKPHWYNEDCVECVENTHCTLPMPVCNESHFCESCPSEKPYYNETTKVCESCSTNYPVYDVDDNQCITCYAANSAKPYWNGTMCTTCPTETPVWSTTQNKCITCYAANSAKPYWNGTMCTTCPTETPVWSTTQNKCITCHAANSSKPYWNGTTCTTCPTETPVWSTTQNKCVTCYTANSAKPYWNGTTCTTCPTETPVWSTTQNKCITCYAANSAKPYWNGTTCTTCPTETPVWSTTQNKCITCYAANSAKPYWNSSTKICEACPKTRPQYDASTNTCGCPDGAKVVNDVCTIVLRNDGGFNACPWGPAPGCIPVVTKFGPYNYNYKVYVDGYVDDNLRFYVNSTNMPSESHYNSWCDWITGTIVKSVGYNHYWQNELMGTLNAGDHGGLLAYSSSGCCYWKNPGKVWLELVP